MGYRESAQHLKTEQALRESEENYRHILETANEGIWIVDSKARTTYVNNKMAEMLGYSPEEMSGKKLSDFIEEDDEHKVATNLERRRRASTRRASSLNSFARTAQGCGLYRMLRHCWIRRASLPVPLAC